MPGRGVAEAMDKEKRKRVKFAAIVAAAGFPGKGSSPARRNTTARRPDCLVDDASPVKMSVIS